MLCHLAHKAYNRELLSTRYPRATRYPRTHVFQMRSHLQHCCEGGRLPQEGKEWPDSEHCYRLNRPGALNDLTLLVPSGGNVLDLLFANFGLLWATLESVLLSSSTCATSCKAPLLQPPGNPPPCPPTSSMQHLDSPAPTPKHFALSTVPPGLLLPVSLGVEFDTPSELGTTTGGIAAVFGVCDFPHGISFDVQAVRSEASLAAATTSRLSGDALLDSLSSFLGTTPTGTGNSGFCGKMPLRRPICRRMALYFSWS